MSVSAHARCICYEWANAFSNGHHKLLKRFCVVKMELAIKRMWKLYWNAFVQFEICISSLAYQICWILRDRNACTRLLKIPKLLNMRELFKHVALYWSWWQLKCLEHLYSLEFWWIINHALSSSHLNSVIIFVRKTADTWK